MSDTLCKVFHKGDRVRVSHEGGWITDVFGTIAGRPKEEATLQGVEYIYFVLLDREPPAIDSEGEGPFRGAIIQSRDLELVAPTADALETG